MRTFLDFNQVGLSALAEISAGPEAPPIPTEAGEYFFELRTKKAASEEDIRRVLERLGVEDLVFDAPRFRSGQALRGGRGVSPRGAGGGGGGGGRGFGRGLGRRVAMLRALSRAPRPMSQRARMLAAELAKHEIRRPLFRVEDTEESVEQEAPAPAPAPAPAQEAFAPEPEPTPPAPSAARASVAQPAQQPSEESPEEPLEEAEQPAPEEEEVEEPEEAETEQAAVGADTEKENVFRFFARLRFPLILHQTPFLRWTRIHRLSVSPYETLLGFRPHVFEEGRFYDVRLLAKEGMTRGQLGALLRALGFRILLLMETGRFVRTPGNERKRFRQWYLLGEWRKKSAKTSRETPLLFEEAKEVK